MRTADAAFCQSKLLVSDSTKVISKNLYLKKYTLYIYSIITRILELQSSEGQKFVQNLIIHLAWTTSHICLHLNRKLEIVHNLKNKYSSYGTFTFFVICSKTLTAKINK